jgi:aminopeptidase N
MKFPILGVVALASVLSLPGHELICAGAFRGIGEMAGAPIDSAQFRKYAPDRTVDILHVAIDVTPDFKQRSVAGTTRLRFKPLDGDVSELRLNAVDLRVRDVSSTATIRAHHSTDAEIIVTFAEPLPADREQEISITYAAFPKKGLYFRTAEMGYRPEDEHLFTQGEDIEARHWFPCFDAPNEKFTSEVACRVPEQMTVLSNGRLVSEAPSSNGLKAVHWLQEKPHVSYLISLVAGHFKKVEDQYKNIHLAFYTPSSQIGLAQSSFAETKEMMGFFEEEIGVPYPWHKYYQVCVQDFMWGGMENTSISTLTDRTLFPSEVENLQSSQGLVAHELVHQWFGDLVTCEDWSQIWLNEGFATYYAHLYNGHKDGKEDFLYGLLNSARGFINRTVAEDSRPIVFRRYDNPTELFGYLVYPKGGWVLHMLRNELGPDVFRKCIKTYLERHQFGTVTTHDLIAVVEKVSDRSFARFFDQWVFHPHHPELQVKYAWDEKEKLAKVSITQAQQLTNDVALFHFPLKLRFKGGSEITERTVQIQEKVTELYFPLAAAPEIFRVDPDYALLAKVSAEVPRNLLVAQLKDESDVMGRIFAIEQLSKTRDKETVDLLAERVRTDRFYGVRIEAAQALGKIRNENALKALIASADQSDARVRHRIAIEIGGWFDEQAADFAHKVLGEEKNPEIKNQAARALGSYPGQKHREALLAALKSDSFEETVADGAITALRARQDSESLGALLTELEKSENDFSSSAFVNGIRTVGALGRELKEEAEKDRAYQFLLKHASSPRQRVQLAAIQALGVLRDERAAAVLEKFAAGSKDVPETGAATRALEQLRAARPAGSELQSLRTEVLDLKKQNDELKKSFDDLKKRLEARDSAKPPVETKKPEAKKRTGLR